MQARGRTLRGKRMQEYSLTGMREMLLGRGGKRDDVVDLRMGEERGWGPGIKSVKAGRGIGKTKT